jgi:predicted Zn finger-like uncharacterized protein
MESVGTKSYRQRSSDTVGFEAPAPHIVVVCPSCKTSFAVETAAVAALETPRFHCSRCDDIFIMKDAPADMLPLGGVNVQSLAHGAHAHRGAQSRGRGPLPESLIKPSDFSLGANTATPKAFIEPNFDAPFEPPLEARSELSLLSRSVDEIHVEAPTIEEQFTFEARVVEQAPVAPTPEKILIDEEVQASGFVVTQTVSQTPTLSSRQFVLADPLPVLPDHAFTHNRAKTQTPPAPKPASVSAEAHPKTRPVSETESYRPTPQPRKTDTQSAAPSEPRRFSARTQSLYPAANLGRLLQLVGQIGARQRPALALRLGRG